MNGRKFVFEQLGKQHNRAAFCCGVDELDLYFRERARQDQRRNITVVHVLQDIEIQRVAGFYTLSATYVRLTDLPLEARRKLPQYPELPATLIGRLAVDEKYQGMGPGRMLLMDALKRSYLSSFEIGSMTIAVDPKDSGATAFYARFGFQQYEGSGKRLYLAMKDVEKLVQAP